MLAVSPVFKGHCEEEVFVYVKGPPCAEQFPVESQVGNGRTIEVGVTADVRGPVAGVVGQPFTVTELVPLLLELISVPVTVEVADAVIVAPPGLTPVGKTSNPVDPTIATFGSDVCQDAVKAEFRIQMLFASNRSACKAAPWPDDKVRESGTTFTEAGRRQFKEI